MPEGQSHSEIPLTDEQRAFDAKMDSVFERLIKAGWVSGGGGDLKTFHIIIGGCFDPEIKNLQIDDVLPSLPVRDNEGGLLPGYEFGQDPDINTASFSYEGPLDEAFEQVVNGLVEAGNNNMESLAGLDAEIGALAISAEAGFFSAAKDRLEQQGLSGVGDGEVIASARQLVQDALYDWRNAVIDAEEVEG